MTQLKSTSAISVIPGWRVILSDEGRLWASRGVPFTAAQSDAGAERTVDADTLEELRVEVDRQEAAASRATERGGS